MGWAVVNHDFRVVGYILEDLCGDSGHSEIRKDREEIYRRLRRLSRTGMRLGDIRVRPALMEITW